MRGIYCVWITSSRFLAVSLDGLMQLCSLLKYCQVFFITLSRLSPVWHSRCTPVINGVSKEMVDAYLQECQDTSPSSQISSFRFWQTKGHIWSTNLYFGHWTNQSWLSLNWRAVLVYDKYNTPRSEASWEMPTHLRASDVENSCCVAGNIWTFFSLWSGPKGSYPASQRQVLEIEIVTFDPQEFSAFPILFASTLFVNLKPPFKLVKKPTDMWLLSLMWTSTITNFAPFFTHEAVTCVEVQDVGLFWLSSLFMQRWTLFSRTVKYSIIRVTTVIMSVASNIQAMLPQVNPAVWSVLCTGHVQLQKTRCVLFRKLLMKTF